MNEIKIGSVWRHKELGTETVVIDVDEKYVKTTTDSSGSGLKRNKDVFLHFYEIVDEEKEIMIDVMRQMFGNSNLVAYLRCKIYELQYKALKLKNDEDVNEAIEEIKWHENYLKKQMSNITTHVTEILAGIEST